MDERSSLDNSKALTNDLEDEKSSCNQTNISKEITTKGKTKSNATTIKSKDAAKETSASLSKNNSENPTTSIWLGWKKLAFKDEEALSLFPRRTGNVSCSGCTFEERGDDVLLKRHCGSPSVVTLKRRKTSAVDHWNSSMYTISCWEYHWVSFSPPILL